MSRRTAFSLSIFLWAVACLLWGCSATKHVRPGELLLDNVSIQVDNDTIKSSELYNFLRQTPNHKVLGFAKLQLATYSLSGHDTTKWYNRWLQNIGQPPVIYDSMLTEKSRQQLRQSLINRGYMEAMVEVDTVIRDANRRIDVDYIVAAGSPHFISGINYNIPDAEVQRILRSTDILDKLKPGQLFDRNQLDQYRSDITDVLRNHGYYTFNKDFIYFMADTVKGEKGVALTLNIRPAVVSRLDDAYAPPVGPDSLRYMPYRINKVYFVTDFNGLSADENYSFSECDTVYYKGITVLYGNDHYLMPDILEEKCYLIPGREYSARAVERTYEALSQLGILKSISINIKPLGKVGGTYWADAFVLLSRNKKQNFQLELEGTNSEGDLGFGVGATYQHRNLARRSELLTAKFRTSYESLSGNFNGLVNNRYTEYAGEVGITFPKFMFPFLSSAMRRRMRSTTEFALSANYQERPEYTRIIAGAAWKYKWTRQRGDLTVRHAFDLVDANYVKLPKSTLHFLDSIAPSNPLLRYSYEDHFIMRMGYTFSATNRRIPTGQTNSFAIQPSVTTIRASVEVAGNVLYGLSSLFRQTKQDGTYRLFGIQYAQYAKAEADYTYVQNLNSRNAVAYHVGLGVAVPYLNSSMVPFEKRFYAGGANSVRGWNVRTLGPGCYDARNYVTDFINQCGDILLNLNMEYRAKLFWVIEGAIFIDAGNIWTIREYPNQPGGVFKINKFYQQIAAAYGLGLRLDFTYFLLRFDLGIKAHNPARGEDHWPLLHPRWGRDATFHFAVGYPF